MHDNRTPTAASPLVAIALCAIAAGLFVLPVGLSESIKSTFHDLATPGVAVVDLTFGVVTGLRDTLFDRTDLETRVAELESQLALATRRNRSLELAAAEHREAPLVDEPSPLTIPDLLSARVLGTETAAAWRAGRLVDVGLDDGVREEAAVLADEGPLVDRGRDGGIDIGHAVVAGRTLVGRIRSVGRWTSVVQPITDAEYRIQVRIARRTDRGLVLGPTGILRGTGEPVCRLDFLGSTEAVAVGDEVYAIVVLEPAADPLGTPNTAPTGDREFLLVGTITRAELPTGAPHWEIEVGPATAKELDRVSILRRRFNPTRLTERPN